MKMQPLDPHHLVWGRNKPMSPEVQQLIGDLRKAKKGVTYEVSLDAPIKGLKTSLDKHINVAAKPKDKTFKVWYVKVKDQKPAKKVE